ncbi:MAG: efflux RND transporter periplasmic adaptor subunit [Paracoccus sp. (in: a-proteobacteria)]|uniref:efflux RND transporter periplasmic adaptor subunit n=1 Tax=Paracoccus sp. TaxID=267 RepID=UPI0039E48B26
MRGMAEIAAAVLVAGMALLPWAAVAEESAAAAPVVPTVTVAPVLRHEVRARVPISGSLVARVPVQVHANVQGHEIREIRAEAGARVKAGDVLALLADDSLKAQLAQAEAEQQRAEAGIRQAESQIVSADAALTQAAAALARTRALRQGGNASQAVLDQAVATEASARAAAASASDGLRVARAALTQAQAARRIAELNLGYARITAPVDGIVTARNAQIGAISGTGADPLFTMIGGGEVELAADVIETALDQLKPEDPAEIEVAGIGTVAGRLRLVPAAVDPATRLGQARITLDSDPRLRPGLFARGWITTDRHEALTVPAGAVLADAEGARVQVVRDGKIQTRPVQAGLLWQDRREILEGLDEGETVLARAGAFFGNGDAVRPVPMARGMATQGEKE